MFLFLFSPAIKPVQYVILYNINTYSRFLILTKMFSPLEHVQNENAVHIFFL